MNFNWSGWWQWAVQHQHRELGLLFILIGVSIPVIGFLTAWQLRTIYRDNPLAKSLSWLFLGIGIMGTFGLIANIDPPSCQCPVRAITYSNWFAWWYWIGNVVLLFAEIAMKKFALHPHNGSAAHKDK